MNMCKHVHRCCILCMFACRRCCRAFLGFISLDAVGWPRLFDSLPFIVNSNMFVHNYKASVGTDFWFSSVKCWVPFWEFDYLHYHIVPGQAEQCWYQFDYSLVSLPFEIYVIQHMVVSQESSQNLKIIPKAPIKVLSAKKFQLRLIKYSEFIS